MVSSTARYCSVASVTTVTQSDYRWPKPGRAVNELIVLQCTTQRRVVEFFVLSFFVWLLCDRWFFFFIYQCYTPAAANIGQTFLASKSAFRRPITLQSASSRSVLPRAVRLPISLRVDRRFTSSATARNRLSTNRAVIITSDNAASANEINNSTATGVSACFRHFGAVCSVCSNKSSLKHRTAPSEDQARESSLPSTDGWMVQWLFARADTSVSWRAWQAGGVLHCTVPARGPPPPVARRLNAAKKFGRAIFIYHCP